MDRHLFTSPASAVAYQLRWRQALAALESGRPRQALSHLDDLLAAHPQRADLHLARSLAWERLGDMDRAVAEAEAARRKAPGFVPALQRLGELHLHRGKLEQAQAVLSEAVRQAPRSSPLWDLLAEVHLRADRPETALRCMKTVLTLAPRSDAYRLHLAEILRQSGAPEGALALLEAAPRRELADWWVNRALAAEDCADFARALESIGQACRLAPDHPLARWNQALLRLRRGHLPQGWQDYHWGTAAGARPPPPPPAQRWQGPDDPRPLWVTPEQGVGDEILFASTLGDLIDHGTSVHWQSDPRLCRLIARAHPGVAVAPSPPAAASRYAQARMGDLLPWLRRDFSHFPRHRGYLAADPQRRASLRAWLGGLGPGIKIGISWRAGRRFLARGRRGIPFPLWEGLFRLQGVVWIALQHGDTTAEEHLAKHCWGRPMHRPPLDPFDDLDGLGALISALDGVITVDNATAHLAGALGTPTLVLLPRVADWRWFLEREDSPWYPSFKLLRQRHNGAWRPVMQRAAGILAQAARGEGTLLTATG